MAYRLARPAGPNDSIVWLSTPQADLDALSRTVAEVGGRVLRAALDRGRASDEYAAAADELATAEAALADAEGLVDATVVDLAIDAVLRAGDEYLIVRGTGAEAVQVGRGFIGSPRMSHAAGDELIQVTSFGGVTTSETDPGSIGANATWVQPNAGAGFGTQVWLRNATNDGWLPVSLPSYAVSDSVGISSPNDNAQLEIYDDGYVVVYPRLKIGLTSAVDVVNGAVAPTSGAGVAAPEGSVYLRTNGTVWTKTGSNATDWSLLAGPAIPDQATYSGNAVSVADGGFGFLTWDNLELGGDGDLLDRTDLGHPALLSDGTYGITLAAQIGDLTPGGFYNAVVTVERPDLNFLFRQVLVAVYISTEVATSLTLKLKAGDTITIRIENSDGATTRFFTLTDAAIVKLA